MHCRGSTDMWTNTATVCWVTLALVAAYPTPEETTERAMQPLSAAVSGNYTISFMPLLTVLVNMFPRLMSRMRVQPITATTQARKLEALWEWERASLCTLVDTTVSEQDPCHFYTCSYNNEGYCSEQVRGPEKKYTGSEIVTSAAVDDCMAIEVRRCSNPTHQYSPQLSTCQPTTEQLICVSPDT